MKINFRVLFACLAFSTIVNGAHNTLPYDIEAGHQPDYAAPSATGRLTPAVRDRVITVFSQDYERNVTDLVQTRWCFRKIANYANAIGNTFAYLALAATPVAAASSLIFPSAVSYIVWSGATCCGVHMLGIGIAKCSANQEDVREKQVRELAQAVGFTVIPIEPVVLDADAAGPNIAPPPPAITLLSGSAAH